MNASSLIASERQLLADLARVAEERERLEPALRTSFQTEMGQIHQEEQDNLQRLQQRRQQRLAELEAELRTRQEAIDSRFAAELEAATKKHGKARWELNHRIEHETQAAKEALKEALWTAETYLEGATADAVKAFQEESIRLDSKMEELLDLQRTALEQLEHHSLRVPDFPIEPSKAAHSLDDCLAEVDRLVQQLQQLTVLKFLRGGRLFLVVFFVGVCLLYPLGTFLCGQLNWDPTLPNILGLGGGSAAIVSVLFGFALQGLLRLVAQHKVNKLYRLLNQRVTEAKQTKDTLLSQAETKRKQAIEATRKRYELEQGAAKLKHQQTLEELQYQRTIGEASIQHRFDNEKLAAEQKHANELALLTQMRSKGLAQIEERFQTRHREINEAVSSKRQEIVHRYRTQWIKKLDDWKPTQRRALDAANTLVQECLQRFLAWHDPAWAKWQPSTDPRAPEVIRFGEYRTSTTCIVESEPWSPERESASRIDLVLPALSSFAEPSSLLFHANDQGREQAIAAMRAILLRMLTTVAPGRVRFLIVDPVGLGQSFGAFMNLADHDEKLVGSRIWTEATHIEQRLADLTGHMENVIQKYLRNRYSSIADYNAEAGEVAEPYRVLVVANFPVNFTVDAMRRLVSIAQSGPRCGVSVLASIDKRQPLPKGFDLSDLEQHAVNLDWESGKFRVRDAVFGRYELQLDFPPEDEFTNRLLHLVGVAAKAAQRVEVPFEFIAPPVEQWWTSSSRKGIDVPLGRAGATRRQLLSLGQGTSQHVLVAGKTGSGKSTLLHALIVNLSLMYSPDEVELYLVDFKKGVEFKIYTSLELPHARVVAIESEREFGLSVLQRLDHEITTRGEKYRLAGVQDLNAYREAVPDARMPRVLLIVDEFQEFFTEDDKIAQEAARLLDRLVRQGRAFGIHVLLGSQTIGGAYSLARSTIDQMAVRIALQCSEADAHLILSDDNSAARLLSRPGEAIYNDANGRVEGNDPFQVVWLGEDQRERYLTRLQELNQQRPTLPRPPMVVFEGNAAADPAKNHRLTQLLTAPVTNSPQEREEQAWLGEAMAIDELTAATFRRQHGSNLLILGQQAESALGMLVTGLIGLSAYHDNGEPNSLARFQVVDGHQSDAPKSGILTMLQETLAEPVRLSGTRELPEVLSELMTELEKRQANASESLPSIYLLLHGIQRMRDLRRNEDDFGMLGRTDEKPTTPDKQLAYLLREGPVFGIHVLLWCDSLNNLNRVFDRQAMRELAMRVAFQMSVTDSSSLIDSPAASKLGMYRALFASEEEGRLEKFRPYGIPTSNWLDWVKQVLHQRQQIAGAGTGRG